MIKRLITLLLGLSSLLACALAPVAAQQRTNVILILADDLGYGDLGCYGGAARTPHLDRLARDGIRFTQFDTPAPYCAPTRSSLMTGRYQFRVGMTGNPVPKEDPAGGNEQGDRRGMKTSEITLGQAMGRAGYRTCCIGKWHLGHRPQYRPVRRGFDEYLGILYSNDMHPVELIADDTVIEYPVVQSTLTRRYSDRAIRFIEENRRRPFFLYLPHAMPHKPLACSEKFYKKSGRGLYIDVLEELDHEIGRMLARLDELGLAKNTLVLFTSDNGPWYGGSAGGLRGMKGVPWEGGLRVPLIARWPGRIPAGRVSHLPSVMPDLYPTVLQAAGVEPPAGVRLDGESLLGVMTGRDSGPSPERPLYSLLNDRLHTVRSGRWKYHGRIVRRADPVQPGAPYVDPRAPDGVRLLAPYEQAHPSQYPGLLTGDTPDQTALFDLDADPAEQHDVSAGHPDLVRRMRGLFEAMEKEVQKELD